MARRAASRGVHDAGELGREEARSRARSTRPVSRYARSSLTARDASVRVRPASTPSIQLAMNGASSAAASRSSSWALAAIEIPSAPGSPDGGGTERRESGGSAPVEPGGGGGTLARGGGGTDAGGGTLGRSPMLEGERDGGIPFPRGVESGARVGGGTNARRAIPLRIAQK